MTSAHALYTNSPLAIALQRLLQKMEETIGLSRPITLTLAGGMAIHLYTAHRATEDVDAEFSARIIIPSDISVEVISDAPEAIPHNLYIDTNYNSSFALMHENYLEDSIPVKLDGLNWIIVRILSPVDLAVSKIARLQGPDMGDICALVAGGLVTPEEIEQRAQEAMAGYIGNTRMLMLNLQDVIRTSEDINRESGDHQAEGGQRPQ